MSRQSKYLPDGFKLKAILPLWLIYASLKIFFLLALCLLAFLCYRHYKAQKLLRFYTEQGFVPMKGCDTFFLGNAEKLIQWKRQCDIKDENDEPIKPSLQWLTDYHSGDGALHSHNCGDVPNFIMLFNSFPHLSIGDPAAIQDMCVTKNAHFDKTGKFERVFKNFFGNSFLFSKADDMWKAKRKAISHAFYKDRLNLMIEALKEQILSTQKIWHMVIEKQGEMNIDLASDVLPIFQEFIMKVIFGADEDPPTVEIYKRFKTTNG